MAELALKRLFVATLTRVSLFCIYMLCLFLYSVCGLLEKLWAWARFGRLPPPSYPYRVLVIGTFYTRNWCMAHLTPIARARNVCQVIAVVDGPTHPIDRVCYSYPPGWLVQLCGRALAKFCWAVRIGLRERPEIVMGYHLLPGAMSALLVARLIGRPAIYQMTAGPVELIGGGAATENFFLKRLHTNSRIGEMLAFKVCARFDLVVVRGRRAREFVSDRRIARCVRIIPGSIDPGTLTGGDDLRPYDVITVCRLVPIKQPEHVLQSLARLKRKMPAFRAIVLGDGPLLSSLVRMAGELGIAENVEFRGHVDNVAGVLKRSKTFLLTSRSEGLSIAMAEAMAAGVVPIVADVGDLSDLVRVGETGWLVKPGAFDDYADRMFETLAGGRWQQLSVAAQAAALRHVAIDSVAARWTRSLGALCDGGDLARLSPRLAKSQIASRLRSRRHAWEATPSSVKRLLAPFADLITPERWLGRRFRETLTFCSSAERWSAEEAAQYQLRKVNDICRLAYERSPYYRAVMEQSGFEPEDLASLADLRALPTIDRDTVTAQLEAMCVMDPHSSSIDTVYTGGTSGQPLRFFTTSDRSALEYAYLVSGWRRAGYDLALPLAVFRGQMVPKNKHGLRHQYDPLLRRHYYSSFHMADADIRRYLSHIASIGPCYLLVYPSSLSTLARFIERSGGRAPANIRGVLAGSEIVYPEDRARAEQVFGVRCFSWYGHSEKLVMAAECEGSEDYHVWPTYGHFELLDEDGQPVTQPGQRGEIVGTGFINTVMPFIRYRTGDFATYVGDHCTSCGRAHPIIRDIRGHRTQEMLVARDGSLISWTALNMHDNTFDCVRQFQFAQHAPGRATLRIVPADGFDQASLERIRRNLGCKLEGRVDFDIERVGAIPLTSRGKSTYVDQKLDLNAFAEGALRS